jgi:hypothetical protein
MKTREDIIQSMCLTYRHDYGLLTDIQKIALERTMGQIFDNCIAPHMTFVEVPDPPPECKTESEKIAFAFGWFKAMEKMRD